MGEYAYYGRELVKIGTCESMLYLRADQRHLVRRAEHSLDPNDNSIAERIRFRFPFPDEDHIEPGAFENPDRGVYLHGVEVPEGVEHGKRQFKAGNAGMMGAGDYLVSLPCPEDKAAIEKLGLRVFKNGHPGGVAIVQQKFFDGRWIVICRCSGCGALYRLETLEDAKPVLDALEKLSKRWELKDDGHGYEWKYNEFFVKMMERVRAGYEAKS